MRSESPHATPGKALRGETWAAITARLKAKKVIYANNDLGDWNGYLASLPPIRWFYRRFEEEYSGLNQLANFLLPSPKKAISIKLMA